MRHALIVIVLVTFHSLLAVEAAEQQDRPNVILILADDLGWKDLGCYGSDVFQTPNLDRLADGGMRFTSAYSASCVCSPTRASIMTGKYPARLDLTIWLGGRGGAPAIDQLPLEETTIAESLRNEGYATAMVGKWHLGGRGFWPEKQGFDLAIGEPHSGSPAGGYYLPNGIQLPGAMQGDYLTDRLTEEAVKFIDENHDRPFFLYQAYHSVHTPIQGRKELVQKHRSRARDMKKSFNAEYAAMIESLDAGVGRIMDRLRMHGLVDNTVVIFTSDNGGFSHSRGKKNNVTDNSPLRFGKGYCYEGGHRVPWIVHYPPVVESGTICGDPVITTDLYPTLLQLTGLDSLTEQHGDGLDLSPVLSDSGAQLDREALYWHYPHRSPQGGTPSGAIRQGDWKLIEFFGDGRRELYNLDEDIGEKHDLSGAMPEKAGELHEQLVDWRERVDAKLPSDTPKKAAPGPPEDVTVTEEFPGFDVLRNVEITKSRTGYEIASAGNGLAMQKVKQPITGKGVVELTIRPPDAFPSNGFLALGNKPTDADTVKCGFLVGGGRFTAFNGAYPPESRTQVPADLTGGEPYNVRVTVDIPAGVVTVQGAGDEITHRLPESVDAINYIGYAVVRTRAEFSEVRIIRRSEPE